MSNGDDNNNENPEGDDDGHTAVMTLDQMKEAGLFDDEAPTEPPTADASAETAPADAPDDDGEHTMMMDAGMAASIAPEPPAAPSPPPAPSPPAATEPSDDDDGEHTMMMDAGMAASIAPEAPASPPPASTPPPAPPAPPEDDDGEHTMMMDASTAASIAPETPSPVPAPPEDDDGEHTMMMDAGAAASIAPETPSPADDDGEHTMMMDPGAASAASAAAPEKEVIKLVPKLRITEGADEGRAFELDSSSSLVGRGLDCDIILNDASVSRKHFRIDTKGSVYTLVNMSQGNGTKVNGVKVKEVQLRHGAVVEAGTTTMRWEDVVGDEANAGGAASSVASQFTDFGAEPEGADSTRMCDLADLEKLPGWEQPGQSAETAPAKGGAGKVFLSIFLVLILLGGGFVAIDKFAGLGVIFDAEKKASGDKSSASTSPDPDLEPDTEMAPDVCRDSCDPENLPTDDDFGGPGNQYASETACLAGCMRHEALKLKTDGNALLVKMKWAEAIKKFNTASEYSPALEEEMERSKRRARKERKRIKTMRRAEELIETDKPKAALKLLKKIPQSSAYFIDAEELIFQAEDNFVVQASDKAKTLSNAQTFDAAINELTAALKMVQKGGEPEKELNALLEEIRADKAEATGQEVDVAANTKKPVVDTPRSTKTSEKRSTKPMRDKAPTVEASTSTKKPTVRNTDKAQPVKATLGVGKAKAVLTSALQKYRDGDFSGAQGLLSSAEKSRASRRDRKKAKRLMGQISAFASSYERGMDMPANDSNGIKILEKALSLDKRLGRAFAAKIKRKLAKFYAFKATQSFNAKQYGKAGRYAKKALGRDPNQKSAKALYQKISVIAQDLLDKATQNRGNQDLAISLLHKALGIFQPGTPGYGEANRLLSELEGDEEDEDDEDDED
jgi:tetratricopeptide (TPR) repeat protein